MQMHRAHDSQVTGRDSLTRVFRLGAVGRRRGRMALSLTIALIIAALGTVTGNAIFSEPTAVAQIGGGTPPPGDPGPGDPTPGGDTPPPTSPLEIVNFNGKQTWQDMWQFTGQVVNGDPVTGLPVALGGLAMGTTTTTGTDGKFVVYVEIPPGIDGDVSAQAFGSDGQSTDLVFVFITG
jgi:hypothetical protein